MRETNKIDPYEMQMNALLAMTEAQNNAEDRKAQQNTQSQQMQHLGNFLNVATAPRITQAEIMAKQTPQDPGLGNQMLSGAQMLKEQSADQYSDVLDRFKNQNQMVSTLAKMKELEKQNKRDSYKDQIEEAKYKDLIQPDITKTRDYKLKAAIEGLTSAKDQKKIDLEQNKETKKDKYTLIDKRDAIDKEFRPFERLYGSIDELEQKFKSGNLSPQDRLQLVRIIVPLSEINPGVVREAEADMVMQQQSVLSRAKGYVTGNVTGDKINDVVVADMFNTAKTLKPVVGNMKYDTISNIANQAKDFGLEKDVGMILGERNKRLLSDPNSFATIARKSSSTPSAMPTQVKPSGTMAPKIDFNKLSDDELKQMWLQKQAKGVR